MYAHLLLGHFVILFFILVVGYFIHDVFEVMFGNY